MLVSIPAGADSDGYFCIGPRYLAYETRLDGAGHQLHIVRFVAAGTLRRARRTIPDFQVHGMRCESDAVMLDGWNATYEVDLTAAVDVRSGNHKPGKLRAGYESGNLAEWNRAATENRTQRIALPWAGATLEIVNRAGGKPCQYQVEARIVGQDEPLKLLERNFERDCGD